MTTSSPEFDVAVIGGGYSGLAAALQLARARISVVVLDAGERRNRFAEASHGFLTHDGSSPDHIAQVAREQLVAYPNVSWRNALVERATGELGEFTLSVQGGDELTTRILILAMGVVDHLPEINGLQDRWGRSVFNCPYCHGFELEQGRVAVIATGPLSFDQALLMTEWGEVTFFTNDIFKPDDAQTRLAEIKGVEIEPSSIARITGTASLELSDGRTLEFTGIAVASSISISDLPSKLGCEMTDETPDHFVKVDEMQATSLPGVFACGDMARSSHNIPFAVADGSMAGTAAHGELIKMG
jgi:thioredoxin reductase